MMSVPPFPVPGTTPIVRVSAASKTFHTPDGRLVEALKAVSLDIPAGRFTTLLGPSGCGKTTLLRLIGGFEEPTGGGIFIDGKLMEGIPAHHRPTNTVFQHYGLFPHLTVAGNVAYGLEIAKVPKAEIRQRVAEALEMVRLPGMETRKITQLSGGQQQRVALARALVLRPKILLLDEPMAALDRKLRKEMQTELKRLQHELGIAFLCVTHDQEEALSMSDLVVVMNRGQIEQQGTPRQIYDQPETEFVAGFVGEISLFRGRITNNSLQTDAGTTLLLDASGLESSPDQPVTACLRPEKLALAKPDSTTPLLHGTVRDATYLGTSTRLEVSLGTSEGDVSDSVIATLHDDSPAIGQPITLTYSPADVRLLRHQG
ncbi:ABC transporter ATP-binding protein [Insolitispirillum peregrinum]|uniref:ABC transporter ATP-binding protein n=1 Tax=Insolitispirillum peregrinum TaxID=80876 RepID=UPI00360DB998